MTDWVSKKVLLMNEEAKISLDEWNEKVSTIFELPGKIKAETFILHQLAAAQIKTTPSKEDIWRDAAREQDGLS